MEYKSNCCKQTGLTKDRKIKYSSLGTEAQIEKLLGKLITKDG